MGYSAGMRCGLGGPSGTRGSRGSFMAIAVGLPCGGSMICGTREGLGTSKEGVLKF